VLCVPVKIEAQYLLPLQVFISGSLFKQIFILLLHANIAEQLQSRQLAALLDGDDWTARENDEVPDFAGRTPCLFHDLICWVTIDKSLYVIRQ